jgi:hypothetical protein
VAAASIGGTLPRHIRFCTDTGKVMVRGSSARKRRALVTQEEQAERSRRTHFGDVTLF